MTDTPTAYPVDEGACFVALTLPATNCCRPSVRTTSSLLTRDCVRVCG